MVKGIIASGTALASDVNIPFTPTIVTGNTTYDSSTNSVKIAKPGYYDVYVSLPLMSAATDPVTIQLYANGTAISEAIAINHITTTVGRVTCQVFDTVLVKSVPAPSVAEISARIVGNTATLSGVGMIIVKES